MQLGLHDKLASIADSDTGPRSRPGLTSLIRTGRGLMTLQTELVGEPATLVTIIDFRGRVLKRWTCPTRVASTDVDAPARIREWHRGVEERVRESLTRAARRRPQADATGEVVANLFVAAMRAYSERDLATARAVLSACDLLLPNDPRIRAALRRLTRA